jgi:hypothetical protein
MHRCRAPEELERLKESASAGLVPPMFVQAQRVAFGFKRSESNRVRHIALRLSPEHSLVECDVSLLDHDTPFFRFGLEPWKKI